MDRWQEEVIARARAFWTDERRQAWLGGKRPFLDPVDAAPLLRVMGLVQRDGGMQPQAIRKLMQVSHMLVLLEPAFMDLMTEPMRIVDVGCGSSYLTLALAWTFAHKWQKPAQLRGVDRQAIVIEKSRERAEELALSHIVRFDLGDAASLDPSERAHAVIALHACDTATDSALAYAVRAQADLIAAVPCCHVELSRAWADADPNGPLAPLFSSPHLRREAAATITDTLRTTLLRAHGYHTTAMELVPSEHTPKNTMLRARRRSARDDAALAEYVALRDALKAPALAFERALSDSGTVAG